MPQQTGSTAQPTARDYLIVVWRRKWLVLGITVLITLVSFFMSASENDRYSSSAKILVQRSSSIALVDAASQRLTPDLAGEIELQFFDSEDVRARARDQLGYSAQPSASLSAEGAVLIVRAIDDDPERAADIANAYATAYVDSRRENTVTDYTNTAQAVQSKIDAIDQRIAELDAGAAGQSPESPAEDELPADSAERDALITQKGALTRTLDQVELGARIAQGGGPQVLLEASAPSRPFAPTPQRDALAGLFLGLFLGVAAAFVAEYLDDSIRNQSELVTAAGGLAVLAVIPRMTEWRNRTEAHLVSIEQPASPLAEAYRTLRTSVQFVSLGRSIRTVQVTSPRSQDGKSTTATNLAVALARAGQRVILIDCDLRRPRVHEFFGLTNAVGFTSVLVGDVPLVNAIQAVPGLDRLRVLASGPKPPDPSELLSSRRAYELIKAISEAGDLVIIDTPPVLPVADALVVSDVVDACILVVTVGSTTRKEVQRSVELLQQVEAPLIGVVMNGGNIERGYGYGTPEPARSRWSPMRSKSNAARPSNGTERPKESAATRPSPPASAQPTVTGGPNG